MSCYHTPRECIQTVLCVSISNKCVPKRCIGMLRATLCHETPVAIQDRLCWSWLPVFMRHGVAL